MNQHFRFFFSDRCQAHQLEMSITTFGSARLKNLLQYFSRKVEILVRQKRPIVETRPTRKGQLIKANFLRPTLFSESLDAN